MEPYSVKLAEVIRRRMGEQSTSIRQLSESTKLPYSTLNRRISGVSPLNTHELALVALALDTTVAALCVAAEEIAA